MNRVLRTAREKLGFTLLEMAGFTGVPSYAGFESGMIPATDRHGNVKENAKKIAFMLDLEFHEVFPEIPQLIEYVEQKALDKYPDDPIYEPTNLYDFKELLPKIEKVLRTLTPREEAVLRMRMGLRENDDTVMTFEAVARAFDVGRERIRQIEAKALRKLRRIVRRKDLILFTGENDLIESEITRRAYLNERKEYTETLKTFIQKQYEIVSVLKEVRYGRPFYAGNRRIWSPLYEDQRQKILDLQHVIDKTAIVPHQIADFHLGDIDIEENKEKWPKRDHVCTNCGAETILLASGFKRMDAIQEVIKDGNGNPTHIIYGPRTVRNHIHIVCITGCTVFVTVNERREKV